MKVKIQLEPEAQAFTEAVDKLPFSFALSPEEGRIALDQAQSILVSKLPVDIEDLAIKNGPSGDVPIRILRPQNAPASLPAIIYIHGGGWVFGNERTYDRLIRELAFSTDVAVVFPSYHLSPEARYPTAIEECYSAAKWVAECGVEHGLDPERIAVAGDSEGGNMAAAVTIMSKERGGPQIAMQVLFYPVTNADFDSASYHDFAKGYSLRRDVMMWFWNQYTTNQDERNQITASPLRSSLEQLKGLPPALILTAEADVVRDEGEAYANRLRQAGVRVTAARFQGAIHDFIMLSALSDTAAARGAMALATAWLRDGFSTRR